MGQIPAVRLGRSDGGIPRHFVTLTDLFVCPKTGEPLHFDGECFSTPSGMRYGMEGGIPQFFVTDEPVPEGKSVLDVVKSFYEETPFPNYNDIDSRERLKERAGASGFAALLDEQLPDGALCLEAGCGTGQMTNFLGMSARRKVIGGDICMNSLKLAKGFRDRHHLRNAAFVQMNLFRPPFRDNAFDVIVTNGVLHHTSDARLGFRSLVGKLKPGGLILVGLYNYYGRLTTLWRRWALETFGTGFHWGDPRLKDSKESAGRFKAWFMDQYRHPHETRHSQDEVLRWFAEDGIEFLSGVPQPNGKDFTLDTQLFQPHPPGSALDRLGVQLGMLLEGGQDGALFIMIGRKKGGAA